MAPFSRSKRPSLTCEEWGLFSRTGLYVHGTETNPLVGPASYLCHSGTGRDTECLRLKTLNDDRNPTLDYQKVTRKTRDVDDSIQSFELSEYFAKQSPRFKHRFRRFVSNGIYPSSFRPSTCVREAIQPTVGGFNQLYLASALPSRRLERFEKAWEHDLHRAQEARGKKAHWEQPDAQRELEVESIEDTCSVSSSEFSPSPPHSPTYTLFAAEQEQQASPIKQSDTAFDSVKLGAKSNCRQVRNSDVGLQALDLPQRKEEHSSYLTTYLQPHIDQTAAKQSLSSIYGRPDSGLGTDVSWSGRVDLDNKVAVETGEQEQGVESAKQSSLSIGQVQRTIDEAAFCIDVLNKTLAGFEEKETLHPEKTIADLCNRTQPSSFPETNHSTASSSKSVAGEACE